MVWTPKFQAIQEEALVDNVLTIVTEDFKSALDYFYPIEAGLPETDSRFLRDFQEHALGQIIGDVPPYFAIGPNRNASTPSAAEDRLAEAVRLDLYVGVTDDSPVTVTRRIMRYVGTLDAVLRSALKSRYFVNMATPFGFVLEMEHVYGPIGRKESSLFRGAQLQVEITINET